MLENENLGSVEIPLTEGKLWAEKYRRSSGLEEDGKNKVDAYLIPLETLKQVLDQDIDAVRAYKGINNAGQQVLMFVGTKLDAKTGIYKDVFKTGVAAKDSAATADGGGVVYNMTQPCPPNGDPTSPMNP
jgi:hypothetical protein